jgi:FkbM family methyltransferase
LDLDEGIDFSIWLLGSFEPTTANACARLVKPGDTVLDIGANIGAHSLLLSRLVGAGGKVICFEPTDYAFTKLQSNVRANPELAARMQLMQVALVEEDGATAPSDLYSSWPLQRGKDLHAAHQGRLMSTGGAQAMTLDSALQGLALSRVDFIKLDIDGFEAKMLRGAGAVLARWHPTIVMELAPYVLEEHGSSIEEVTSILQKFGYGYWSLNSRPLPSDSSELRRMIPQGASLNVIARSA